MGDSIYKNSVKIALLSVARDFIVPLVFLVIASIGFYLHFNGAYAGNKFGSISWILAVGATIFIAYKKSIISKPDRSYKYLIFAAIVLYFASHALGWSSAPWNNFGLFDDAAWDLYFMKDKVDGLAPFQTLYFDSVGQISRESLFHWYIYGFFQTFGWNLQSFNLALLALGFITVLFTSLISFQITKSITVAIFALFLINFYPLAYTQTFMGHRYAIVLPLITASYFFALIGFEKKSLLYISLAGVFAGFAMQGGVAGKQFIYAGMISGMFLAALYRRQLKDTDNLKIIFVLIGSLIISLTPLLFYVMFNWEVYSLREQALVKEFRDAWDAGGINGIERYIDQARCVFFENYCGARQFMSDFHVIPLALVPAICIGFYQALKKQRYELIPLIALPILGGFIAGIADFRISHMTSFLIVVSSLSVAGIFHRNVILKLLGYISACFILSTVVISASYMNKVKKDPNHIHYLPHIDVAVSRYMQDLAFGANKPSIEMKFNEFKRTPSPSQGYASFFCPAGAYAIAHLYLKDVNDNESLSICGGHISSAQPTAMLAKHHIDKLTKLLDENHRPQGLLLSWQRGENINPIIDRALQLASLGEIIEEKISIDDREASLVTIKIPPTNANKFISKFNVLINELDTDPH